MKLLQYTWKNSMMKIANSKMAVFVILMIVVSRSYVGAIRQFSVAVDYPSSWCVFPFAMCSFSDYVLVWSNLCELGCAFYAACEYVSCNPCRKKVLGIRANRRDFYPFHCSYCCGSHLHNTSSFTGHWMEQWMGKAAENGSNDKGSYAVW